jgi:hypothetical protein
MIAIIKRDGKEIDRVELKSIYGVELLNWFHRHCSYSMSWALRYEGYSYEVVEE